MIHYGCHMMPEPVKTTPVTPAVTSGPATAVAERNQADLSARALAPGAAFGAIESVKASSDLLAPVGGEVVAVNSALDHNQEPINQDPYGAGWLIRIRPDGASEELLDAAAYTTYCEGRAH